MSSLLLLISLYFTVANAASFNITNNCPFTVWPAAYPGGGVHLNPGQNWLLNVNNGTRGRIWARTNCQFNASGRGSCQTGDCGGLLKCQGSGSPLPITLVEFSLNQFSTMDYIDISIVDGFNVPIEVSSVSRGCNRVIRCKADIFEMCPTELRDPGGCNGPCAVFNNDQYCCTSGDCGPTVYSKFFKDRCPDAYSYPKDDQTRTITCPVGTNYKVVFCPPT